MKIDFKCPDVKFCDELKVGNVYPCRGGRPLRYGHLWVVASIAAGNCGKDTVVLLQVNRNGEICGAETYGSHYFEDKTPIAFVEGLEDVNLTMRGLP